MTTTSKPAFSRPRDESLAAYREWICELTRSLGGDVASEDVTEAEWIDGWCKYWGRDGSERVY